MDPEEMSRYAALERDAHGNLRLGEIELGRMLKNEVKRRLKERGISLTIVEKDIGYEFRCADPIPFDLEYTQDLGYAAVTFLLSGGSGAIVTVERGRIIPIPFHSILDDPTRPLGLRG
jgi:6-phosphofructokinase 1